MSVIKRRKKQWMDLLFWSILLVQTFTSPLLSFAAEAEKRPNILFIIADDMNDELGFFGDKKAKSPHLDQLASRSVVFENAHCQAPICGPSRNSFLTGKYPHHTGLYGLDPLFRDVPKWKNLKALPEFFKENGYSSDGVGKIYHTTPDPKSFDKSYGWFGGFGPKPPKLINLDPKLPVTPMYDWGPYLEDSETSDYKVAETVIGLIQEKSKSNKPFFIAAGFFRPHCPTYAPQRWFDLHPKESIPDSMDQSDDMKDIPTYGQDLVNYKENQKFSKWLLQEPGRSSSYLQAYRACVSCMDFNVGRVLEALKASGEFDNTIIVFCSDHGVQNGSKNLWYKRTLWEKSTRVPFIIKPASKSAEGRIKAPVGLIDLYPTLCDLTGFPAPDGLDGKSLIGLIEGKDDGKKRSPVLTGFGPGNFSLRDERWRYIRYLDGAQELYDHHSDPNETKNLANNPEFKPILDSFSSQVPVVSEPFVEGTKGLGSSAFPGM